MILIGNYDSPFVRRVGVAMHHYGFPFERKIISVFRDFEAMLEINPLGKVPALEINDGNVLVDSRFIIDYLEGLAEDERKLIPINSKERQAVLQIEAIALGLAETSVKLRIELYRKNPTAHDPDWILRLEQQIKSALTWLEKTNPSPWLYGSRLSLPDITTVVAYTYLKQKLPDFVPPNKYPCLDNLWEQCEALGCKVKLRKSQTVLLALGIFLWAHFIPGIASPPWFNPDKSHLEGQFSFSTKYLGMDLDSGMTLGKLEELLITGNVRDWIILTTLFILGIYSCWLIFKGSGYWPYLVFLLSGYISVKTIPPIIDLFNFHPTWGEHFAYVIGYIPRHASSLDELLRAYLLVMYVYVSPILFGGLFLYSIYEIVSRVKKRQIAA